MQQQSPESLQHPHSSTKNVFSRERDIKQPLFSDIEGLKIDQQQKMDGLALLAKIHAETTPLVFFDPQYRTVLDKQNYGNEGKNRGKKRSSLPQMSVASISSFLAEIERVLIPSGHLMLWVDKFILGTGINKLIKSQNLKVVDLITWDKQRMGMGYRTRHYSEHLVIAQKPPIRAKGVWRVHDIPDVWSERVENGGGNHTHAKPILLQKKLIEAVTNAGDIVIDPAAGGYSVMTAALETGRHFLGCDLLG